tara:strand:- start:575 stop:1777 length:1203 start_codon:yes stop_codon:yes gene_type:complete
MPHAPGHGGDFGRQYSQQIINTPSRRVGLENTKAYQQIVQERNQSNAEQQLNQIVNSRGSEGFRTDTIDPDRNFGKRTGKFNDIRDKMLNEGYNSLNEAEKSIANFYLSSAPNQYQSKMDQFIKASPENRAAYKKKFGFMGNLNLLATELPEKIAEKTMIGNILSGLGNVKDKVVDTTLDFFNIGTEEQPNFVSGETYDPNRFIDSNFRDPIMDMVETDSTNIEEIKDKKNKTKQRINTNNLDVYNIESGRLLNNFRNMINKGIANSSALPPNFAETFAKLRDTNQLASGDILKAQNLLRDVVPANEESNNQSGIINALPSETDLALGLNFMPTLEDLQNNRAVNTIGNVYNAMTDDQGLDINLQNRSLEYNKPMFGGNLKLRGDFGDNAGASLMFEKLI